MFNKTSLVKKNLKLYIITQWKLLELEANAFGISRVKNLIFSWALKKSKGVPNHIGKLIFAEKVVVNPKEISQKTCSYYETLFRKKPSKSETETKQFLGNVTTPILINSLKNLFKKELSKDGLYKAMICMSNSKFPENDYQTKEFYERFWNYLKAPYVY